MNRLRLALRLTRLAGVLLLGVLLGALVSARQAAALQDSVPQTRIIHFAEAGHSIRRDQFQGYMNVIHRFCATVTASTDLRMVWPMHHEA